MLLPCPSLWPSSLLFVQPWNWIGWDVTSADAFIAKGFESIALLGFIDKDCLKSVCKTIHSCVDNHIPIPALNEYCLYAMHLWVSTLQSNGPPIMADLYTPASAKSYLAKLRQATATKDEDQDWVKQPDALLRIQHGLALSMPWGIGMERVEWSDSWLCHLPSSYHSTHLQGQTLTQTMRGWLGLHHWLVVSWKMPIMVMLLCC